MMAALAILVCYIFGLCLVAGAFALYERIRRHEN